ncbi:MAG: OmpA family protein, partial [Paracoccaceae bacterium]
MVAAGTTAGTYQYTYEICEVLNPSNCDTAVATVAVDAPPIVANDDTVASTSSGPVVIDLLANDSGPNPLDPTSVILTGTGASIGSTLSTDGKTLTVPGEGEWVVDPTTGFVTFTPTAGYSGTPTPAAYVVSDTMGRVSNEALLRITVLPPLKIIANDDGPITLNGITGANSGVSVLDNDTLDGSPITDTALVNLTPAAIPTPAAGSVTLEPAGTITVASGTTPGTYTIDYEICEVANPTNCSTAQASIVVLESESLIAEIEEDLTAILQDDLVNTLTTQSRQVSGYSADAVERLRERSHDRCLAQVNARLSTENILFDTGRAVIKPVSGRTLDEISVILINCAGSAFEIAGHTDSDASDAYNLDLSQSRVEAVLRALTARGVDTEGFIVRGYGESQPIASNATAAGKAQNRRVEFRQLNDDYQLGLCDNGFELARVFNLTANDDGVSAEGGFLSDRHDCITDRREVFEGTLSHSDIVDGQSQSAINLSYRREQYRGDDSVFGYFFGLYGTNSDVSNRAEGAIRGIGVNAGVYGAKRMKNQLFLDYYLASATGHHTFDLNFDRTVGTIVASGDYRYIAGFAGAALSGELDLGETLVTPRIGFDYVYSTGAGVDVAADLNGLSQVGNFDLDSVSGGRIFAEVRTDRLINGGETNLWFNPRIACYQSLGSLDGNCGVGGSLGLESAFENSDLSYAVEVDGEWGSSYFLGSLRLSANRQIGTGVVRGDAGLSSDGQVTMGARFEIDF